MSYDTGFGLKSVMFSSLTNLNTALAFTSVTNGGSDLKTTLIVCCFPNFILLGLQHSGQLR